MKKAFKILGWLVFAMVLAWLIAGVAFLFSLGGVISAEAEGDNSTSGNYTEEAKSLADELSQLLPDISSIYRKGHSNPLLKAEEDITDPDIAEFYHGYLKEIGLGEDQ